jgi:hypothetical protein
MAGRRSCRLRSVESRRSPDGSGNDAADRVVVSRKGDTDRSDRANAGDRNKGGDESIFDDGRAAFAFGKTQKKSLHRISPS